MSKLFLYSRRRKAVKLSTKTNPKQTKQILCLGSSISYYVVVIATSNVKLAVLL